MFDIASALRSPTHQTPNNLISNIFYVLDVCKSENLCALFMVACVCVFNKLLHNVGNIACKTKNTLYFSQNYNPIDNVSVFEKPNAKSFDKHKHIALKTIFARNWIPAPFIVADILMHFHYEYICILIIHWKISFLSKNHITMR